MASVRMHGTEGVAAPRRQIPIKVVVVTMFEIGEDTGDRPGEFQAWVELGQTDDRAAQPKALVFDYGAAYGYLWWLGRAALESGDIDWVGGLGYGGQRLYVVPSEDLIVAVTAGVFRRSDPQGLAGTTALDMVLRATIAH
jgi:CubicO group peptidase (beta-lactamase class C family)